MLLSSLTPPRGIQTQPQSFLPNPQYPLNVQYPSNTQYPSQQQYPSNTQYPSQQQYPSNTQYPSQQQYPSNTQYPSQQQYPSNTQYPSQQQYPSNTQYPSQQQYPSNTQHPPPQQYQPYPLQNPVQPTQLYPAHLFPSLEQLLYPEINYPNAIQNLIPEIQYEGTVKPIIPFVPSDDAEKLYKAMKGFGTNETVLIDILCRRSNQQRIQIASVFKTAYGKDLLEEVISETSGNFRETLKALLVPEIEYEASELKFAVAGAGTDEGALCDILCTKTNAQMIELKKTYKQIYNKEIENDVSGDVSGSFKRILVSLINARRSEVPGDINIAKQLANDLYNAGEKKLGTDEDTFNKIFASVSYAQLKMMFEEYYKLTGHDIEQAIVSEMSGSVKEAFLTIIKTIRNLPAYFAERLYKSMKGLGTRDRMLIRNIVLHCETNMKQIKLEFQRKYSQTLESFIKGDTSGDYRKALLCLVGDENWKNP